MNETRQRLLAATRRCVAHRGLAGTTSREITAEADANLAAITYHFGSKDHLVAEALLDGLREWLQPGLDALAGADDPAAGMLTAVQALLASFEEHRDEAPVHLEALVHSPRLPALHDGVVDLWAELRSRLAAQITEMRTAGLLPAWVEPAAMAALLVAVATGVVLQATVDPEGPPVDQMASQFAGLLLAAHA
jgi:AcrR family transcriptional regulator